MSSGSKKPNGAPNKPEASTTRFQIASRLGALRDTALLSDPFQTSARFTIRRKGSRAHQKWTQDYYDNNAFSSAYLEELALGDAPILLTEEETTALEKSFSLSADTTIAGMPRVVESLTSLASIINRLRGVAVERDTHKKAVQSAIRSGHTTISRVFRAEKEKELEEAVFLLASWDSMPGQDDDGNEIQVPYTEQAARDLLTNDTPLEGCGLDELVLSVPCWCLSLKGSSGVGSEIADEVSTEKRVIIPDLTLGQAYILWVHDRAEQLSLFRDQVLETAGKNSLPSSDSTSSSGDGTSLAEPVADPLPI